MALNNRQRQFGVNYEQDEITTLLLRSHGSTLAIQIDIKHNKEAQPDFLFLQLSNNQSHVIFQYLFRPSQRLMFTCPDDVLRSSLATVAVYGLQTVIINTRVWHRILMGGKASVNLTGGVTTNYVMVTVQPLRTYLDLLADAPNKIPYHVDVVNIGPFRYVLTDLHHRDDHTNGVIILLHQLHPPDTCIMFHHGSSTTYEIPFDLKPATAYTLQLFRVHRLHAIDYVFIGNSHSTVTTLTTYMTQNEVLELYNKAIYFLSRRPPCFSAISHFYRNKSKEYFSKIMSTDGVMHKYIKNWGGDQASTLNRQVQGLFFSASVDQVTRLPPDFSYFGSVRLHVRTYNLLNNNINMYFSDFYCHRVNHKVQLVLAVKDSPTDRFCRQRLALVDQYSNPFLMRVRYGFSETVMVTMNVTVEVFYTEDVPIRDMMCHRDAHFTRTKQKGNALAMVNGIPKNRNCRICNLDRFPLDHNML